MLEPLPSSQWTESAAAHLLNRAGFGGSPEEIRALQARGLDGAVSWLVDYEKTPDPTPPPGCSAIDADVVAARDAIRNTIDPEAKRQLLRVERMTEAKDINDLRYWWLRRMALGPRPFQEKMTLFWHGHFATSSDKVRFPYFFWLQNDTLRRHATGRFNDLLGAVSRDPAMLLYLDGARSNKSHPNQNYGREVMELFTLGEGHYTEKDVREAARAFTGWGLSKDRLHYEYHPGFHDDGPKTFLGQTGNFTGEQALDIICAQPQCAKFLSAKIWRFFVQDQPPEPVVDALADEFHRHDLDLKHLMGVIFRSREFYAPEVVRSQIKSPVQWLVAAVRQLEAPLPTQPMCLVMLAGLGQQLFQPPNVKGWDGGIAWITTNSLLDRYNYAAALVEGERIPLPSLQGRMKAIMNDMEREGLMQIAPIDVKPLFSPQDLADGETFLAALQNRFLDGSLGPQRLDSLRDFLKARSPIEEADIRKAIRLLMSTPEYQLT